MARLFGFDYKSPYFYMVTLKALKGTEPFSQIGPTGLIENETTKAFNTVIRSFHLKWRCLDEISPFVVMPDHIHLLIKIKEVEKPVSLGVLVSQLSKALRAAYWELRGGRRFSQNLPGPAERRACAAPPDILEKSWHDWIVKKSGQLAAFRRYIKENPIRAHLRQENKRFFSSVTTVQFCGREWFAYGNTTLLDLPVITPFKCSRKLVPDSREWRAFTTTAERIGPGGAGIGTFMSPCEKECGNAIAKAGGSLIILSPEGFGERWHPPRIKERFCAAGRMLFLSLYPAGTRKCDNATLYKRCHEMGDIVVNR
jgi:REP element-mobilizing transposase RayT